MAYCEDAAWPDGEAGAQEGNSIACRFYHSGAPAMNNASLHGPHSGPTGEEVCGSVSFRTDAAAAYTRVDAMGVPGVSTFLVPTFTSSVQALHASLDADLATRNEDSCSTNGGTTCWNQNYATGATVASLVLPTDRLTINPGAPAGFPNGRKLDDRAMDIMLAVLLLG